MVIPPEDFLLWRIVFPTLGFFVIQNEFADCTFQLYEELICNFDGDYTESVDCFQHDGHFNYINPANQ